MEEKHWIEDAYAEFTIVSPIVSDPYQIKINNKLDVDALSMKGQRWTQKEFDRFNRGLDAILRELE